MPRYAVFLAGAFVVLAAGCFLVVDTTGFAGVDGGGSAGDAALGGDAVGRQDAAGDSAVGEGGVLADGGFPEPVVIVASAGVGAPTGNAQQQHLVYASASKSFVFVTLRGANDLAVWSSTDFVSWSAPTTASLPLAHGGDGRNVGIAVLPTTDVLHAAVACISGGTGQHVHARAIFTPSAVTFDPMRTLSSMTSAPTPVAGPATAITLSNGVVDAMDLVAASGSFNGAVWRVGTEGPSGLSAGAATQEEFYFPTNWISAQTLIPLSTGGGFGDLLYAGEAGDLEPDPANIEYGLYAASIGTWTKGTIFVPDASQNINDWSLYRVSDAEIHAVRYAAGRGFDHRRFSGSAWSAGEAIPAMTPLVGGGLVLVGEGASFSLFAIDAGASRTIKSLAWSGSNWASTWQEVTKTPAVRSYLGGLSSPGHKALYWSQANGGALDVVGLALH